MCLLHSKHNENTLFIWVKLNVLRAVRMYYNLTKSKETKTFLAYFLVFFRQKSSLILPIVGVPKFQLYNL